MLLPAVKKILRAAGWVLAAYLIYALVTGIFLYLLPVHTEHTTPPEQFQGHSAGPDRALLVETPHDAFSRRMEIIRSAQNSLDVSYHCVKKGETTDCFFAELIQAADRGVRVRVLLDGAIGGLTGDHQDIDLALISHPNIEYRRYNPIRLLKPWEWNVRLHDKFILADDAMLMLGGRNIGDEYFDPPAYEGKVTHDRDVLVVNTAAGQTDSGSATEQVRAYMDLLWNAKETDSCRPLQGRKLEKGLTEQDRLRALSQRWETTYPDYYLPAVPAEELSVPTRHIQLLFNPLASFKTAPELGASLARLLVECENVRIQTPYATANPDTLEGLRTIAEKANVEFLTNSAVSTPNFPAFSAYHAKRQHFLDTGIHIHEYQSTNSIHGKSCTADGHYAVVGSFNLDDRSLYIDTESVLVIDSPEFCTELNGRLDDLFAQSAQVGPDNEYLPKQSVEVLEASGGKKFLLGLVSVFSQTFRFLI